MSSVLDNFEALGKVGPQSFDHKSSFTNASTNVCLNLAKKLCLGCLSSRGLQIIGALVLVFLIYKIYKWVKSFWSKDDAKDEEDDDDDEPEPIFEPQNDDQWVPLRR